MKAARSVTLYLLGLGIPLLMLPGILPDSFGLPKFILLIAGVTALLLIWGYDVFNTDRIRWRSTPFDVPVLLFGAAYLVSTLIASPNAFTALLSSAGSGPVLLLVITYFLITQTGGKWENGEKGKPPESPTPLLSGLTHAAVVLSLWTIANLGTEFANFEFQISNFRFPAAALSPTGSLLTQSVFLLILLVYLIAKLFYKNKPAALNPEPTAVGLLTITTLGLVATVYKLMQAEILPLLPYRFGWAIGLDAFKNSPIFGVGPANFVSAFTRFKPIAVNLTEYWNASFGLSSNHYLHVLTTVGLLGLAAYVWIIWRVLKTGSGIARNAATLALAISFLLQLFFPFTLPLLFVEFAFLAVLGSSLAAAPAALRLVTVREGIVAVEDEDTTVLEYYEETKV